MSPKPKRSVQLLWGEDAFLLREAAASLLDTYEQERLPVATVNCHQSLTNAFKMVIQIGRAHV